MPYVGLMMEGPGGAKNMVFVKKEIEKPLSFGVPGPAGGHAR
jgi:hypothetical protein